MALEIVQAFKGEAHVTAEQWADFNRGIYGEAAILPVGNCMSVDIQSANQIVVKDGVAVFDGREMYIGYGEVESVVIVSGTQGMKRNDIVVVNYTKDGEGVENVAFEVVTGTPSMNPVDPEIKNMDIRTGVTASQKPLCRVRLNGVAIEGIDMLVEVKELKGHAFMETAKTFDVTKDGIAADAKKMAEVKRQVDEQKSDLSNKLSLDLLWTNTSPDKIFEPKTISLKLTDYEFIGVVVRFSDAWDGRSPIAFIRKNNVGSETSIIYGNVERLVYSVTNNGVNFGAGKDKSVENNKNAIPVQIYGIKCKVGK